MRENKSLKSIVVKMNSRRYKSAKVSNRVVQVAPLRVVWRLRCRAVYARESINIHDDHTSEIEKLVAEVLRIDGTIAMIRALAQSPFEVDKEP